MIFKGLRRKISLVLIVPLIAGLILTGLSSFLPLYIYYSRIIESYTDNMSEDQTNILFFQSSLLSLCAGVSYIQQIANYINIAADVMEKHLSDTLDVNPSFNYSLVSENAVLYMESHINDTELNEDLSLWYLNLSTTSVSELSAGSFDNLNSSSIFDSIIKPISQIESKMANSYQTSYLVFSDDGFFYLHPATYKEFLLSDPNQSACKYNPDELPQYDPRCRPYYEDAAKSEGPGVVITSSYRYADSSFRGETACRSLRNHKNPDLILMYCIDFLVDDTLERSLISLTNTELTYTIILDFNGKPLYYPGANSTKSFTPIIELEFPSASNGTEAKYFNDSILPLFLNGSYKVVTYEKNNEEMTIAITPVFMNLTEGPQQTHFASVGVVMKTDSLRASFTTLENSCIQMLVIELYISIGLLIMICIGCIILTDKITISIIAPIDRLLTILKRMKNDDLDMDILASYEPSPPEISCLYKVFDKLRVVLRFNKISQQDLTQATLIYSQALNLFKQFGNEKAMEICYRELGYICFKRELWTDSTEYLYQAYELALASNRYDSLEIAKRKAETANAMIKANTRQQEAIELLADAVETFKKQKDNDETTNCLVDIAELLCENSSLTIDLLKFIENKIIEENISNKDIIMQRFLYVCGLYYKKKNQLKKACKCFVSALEDFPVYLPFIRDRSLNQIKQIFFLHLGVKIDVPVLRKQRQDIVFIISSEIVDGPVSWSLPNFFGSLLEASDRISLLQFHSQLEIIFNLTKIPSKMFALKKFHDFKNALLYDAVLEGIKQLNINRMTNKFCDHNEWIIIVTGAEDRNSIRSFNSVLQAVKESKVNLIIVSYKMHCQEFQTLVEATQYGILFDVFDDQTIPDLFKQIEAYLCPDKEVLLE